MCVHTIVKIRHSSSVIPVENDDEQQWYIVKQQHKGWANRLYHFCLHLYASGAINVRPVRRGNRVFLGDRYVGACNGASLRLVLPSKVRVSRSYSYDGRTH